MSEPAARGLVELPRFGDERGMLSFLEACRHVPFRIGSVTWWHAGMPALDREIAGGGAQGFVALRGHAAIAVDDGASTLLRLDSADRTLVLPPGARWTIEHASADAVVMVVSSCDSASPGAVPARPCEGSQAVLERPWARSSVADCRLLDLPVAPGLARSAVSAIAPFHVERLYWLYGVPQGQCRGSHAHKELRQLIVAAAGAFDIRLDDGVTSRTVRLDRPDVGLYVPRRIWRDLIEFTPGAVCLVLASRRYEAEDYVRDYDEYVQQWAVPGVPS